MWFSLPSISCISERMRKSLLITFLIGNSASILFAIGRLHERSELLKKILRTLPKVLLLNAFSFFGRLLTNLTFRLSQIELYLLVRISHQEVWAGAAKGMLSKQRWIKFFEKFVPATARERIVLPKISKFATAVLAPKICLSSTKYFCSQQKPWSLRSVGELGWFCRHQLNQI